MSTSYNGWSASPDLDLRPLVVAGEAFVPGVRNDPDVFTLLQYVAQQMHERVEPIVRSDWHQMDDWGFSYRASTGDASALSCHASGTAIDYNATRHPYGIHNTFTQAQIAEVHKILAECSGCIRWGNDWQLPDGMHFEIKGTKAEVAAAADRIRNNNTKDWFDMATEAELRAIVREEINRDEFLGKVGNAAAKHVWNRRFETVNANGATVRKAASAFVKETWTIVKGGKPAS